MFYSREMIESTSQSVATQSQLTNLYLDFDSFFASAEQHFNPALRGQAVGVIPLDVANTGCIAISREAKAQGVPSGVTVREVRTIAPGMTLVVARPDAYVRLHHRVLEVIGDCIPISKVRSIDEVVCRFSPIDMDEAVEMVSRVKRSLTEHFSAALTCSIGVGPSELTAKMAAEHDKPDGAIILGSDDLPGLFQSIALRDIPGVSKGIERRLLKAGIHDFEALWNMGSKQCRALWGSIEGERFWNGLHGQDYVRPPTQKRMFGHSRMLPLDWRTPAKIRECSRQLVGSAARRLRRSEFAATALTMSVRGGGYRSPDGSKKDDLRWSCEARLEPTRDDLNLNRQCDLLVAQFADKCRFTPRSVSITLHGLVAHDAPQGDFLALASPDYNQLSEKRRRNEKISATLDHLREHFGPKAATLGLPEAMPGGYLGAKIAFGRIPDASDFGEETTRDQDTHFASH